MYYRKKVAPLRNSTSIILRYTGGWVVLDTGINLPMERVERKRERERHDVTPMIENCTHSVLARSHTSQHAYTHNHETRTPREKVNPDILGVLFCFAGWFCAVRPYTYICEDVGIVIPPTRHCVVDCHFHPPQHRQSYYYYYQHYWQHLWYHPCLVVVGGGGGIVLGDS